MNILNAIAELTDKEGNALPAYDKPYCGQRMAMLLVCVENANMIEFSFPTEPAMILHSTWALLLLMCAVLAWASDERVPYGLYS